MTTITGMLPLKRIAMQCAKFFPLLILTFFVTLSWLPVTGFAEQERPGVNEQKPEVTKVAELKQKAQDAYVHGHYAEAAANNLEIAQKYPASKERRYAVQMLGTIYEDNLTDIKKAIKWDREFLKKYADPRQVSFYTEKVATLEKLVNQQNQEEAFKNYRKIKFANKGDAYLVKNYEALLKTHPDFTLKVEVQKELAYAYDRMNKHKESYDALQAVAAQTPGHKLSSTDLIMADDNHTYWKMDTTWKWVAWVVVAALWGAVLLMKPWKRFDRTTIKTLLILIAVWILLAAARMPTFYSMETGGYKFVIKDTAIYTLAALNMPVILWVMLLTRGGVWVTWPRTLRLVSPLLTMVMTVSVIYLFIAHQPNGPEIIHEFGEKYDYLIGEFRKGM